MTGVATDRALRVVGRYALFSEIASGGMATVHLGRLLGPVGFSRTVAIKRLHATYARDPEFVSMFLDEARLAARIRHPNVVPVLDVVTLEGELFLVMDYVQGESLARLLKSSGGKPLPPRVVVAIMAGTLHGLHAAHEARSERDEPLFMVHRDVSPQNVLVGADGVARVTDFGVAKAANRVQSTREGQLKGKLAYMSPEQLRELDVDRRTDVYAAGVVAWESFTGRRLFSSADPGAVVTKILTGSISPPSELAPDVPPEVDAVVLRSLAKNPDDRYATAKEFGRALENALAAAPAADVSEWMESFAKETLAERAKSIAEMESVSSSTNVEGVRSAIDALAQESSARFSAPGKESSAVDVAGESPSQLSSASVSRDRSSRRPSPTPWLLGGGLALVVVLFGAWRVTRPGPLDAIPAPPALASVAPTPTPTATPRPSATAPEPAAPVVPTPAPSAVPSAEPPAATVKKTPGPRVAPRPKPAPAATGGDFSDLMRK